MSSSVTHCLTRPAALLLASTVVTLPTNAHAQSCTLETPAGTLVTEGRGASGAAMVVTSQGIAITWREPNPARTGGFNMVPTVLMGRAFDGNTLSARGPAVRVFAEPAGQTSTHGSLAAFADGRVILSGCSCTGRTGQTACTTTTLLGSGNIAALQASATGRGDCTGASLSSAVLGSDLLLSVSTGQRGRALWLGTAVTAQRPIPESLNSGSSVLTAVSPTRALYARTLNDEVVARWVDATSAPQANWVHLSTARMSTSFPVSTSVGGAALTFWSERAMPTWNWRTHISTWRPDGTPANAVLDLGPAPTVPLSATPIGSAGCVLLAWREGDASGQATLRKLGRVCQGALDRNSVFTYSGNAPDFGSPVVAAQGDNAYVLWTVHSDRPFAEQELRISRVRCR